MANIKNLQMWDAICSDNRISINKSFFGLKNKVIYAPTHSEIDAKLLEYDPQTGERLKSILRTSTDLKEQTIGSFHPQPTVNGNYMLEICASRDGAFIALLLLHFEKMNYEPVTSVMFYEGNQAKIISELF
jgi:hypothetical protein